MEVTLRQLVGRRVVSATDRTVLRPPTEPVQWHLRIGGRLGFAPGPARIVRSRLWDFDSEVKVGTYSFVKDTVRLR